MSSSIPHYKNPTERSIPPRSKSLQRVAITMDSIFLMLALSMAMGALLLILLIFVFWVWPTTTRKRLQRNGFDGPPPRFPLGNLTEMGMKENRRSLGTTHDIHSTVFSYFSRWRKTYGKVFVYWLGTEPFLYIAEPEFLKQLTSGAMGKKWGKPDVFKHDRKPIFGNGLVMLDGDTHLHHRHTIAPAFSMTNLNAMIDLMSESTTKMLDQWNEQLAIGNQEMDVERYITMNAAEIIAKTSFGLNEEVGKKVFHNLQTMQSMLFKSNRLVGVPFSKLLNPIKTYEAWKLGKEIDGLLASIIDSRMNKKSCNSDDQQDLLGLLLAGRHNDTQNNWKLTNRDLIDECKTFFFAGHETTALAVTWTLLVLALHPEWQEILREEIMDVTKGGTIESSMLTSLTKMGWVLNEILRLYSPAPNVQRQAKEDIHIRDFTIPKGTNMWVDVVGMHHDSTLWGADVNEFKPERFKDGEIHGGCKHRMAFLPFGFGGRLCIGRNLSAMEYKIVLSLILQKFSMSVSPSYVHAPKIMLSLRPSLGVPLILHPLEERIS